MKQILGGRGQRYAATTRARVEAAATASGYRRNAGARAVATGRFRTLALLVDGRRERGPAAGSLWDGMHRRLARDDFHLSVTVMPDGDAAPPPKILREHHADGLLIDLRHVPPGFAEALSRHRIPAVWIDRPQALNAVVVDDVLTGRQMTEALLRAGHRRVACWSSRAGGADRREGYRAAMAAAGLPASVAIGATADDQPAWLARVRDLLQRRDPPTAVVAIDPATAYPVLVAAAGLGLAVPRDLSLATAHDAPATDAGTPLSTWILPFDAMGEAAVEMALHAVAGRRLQTTVRVPCARTVGDSIARPRTD